MKKEEIVKGYKSRNEEVVTRLVKGEITTSDAKRELDKILGIALVKLSEITL